MLLNWLRMRVFWFPVWVWILLIAGGGALFLWWRKRNGGTSSSASSPTSSGQAPQLQDPPFVSDPQYGGGRQEPGWSGPNSDVPAWMNPPSLGSPGSSFEPPLSDTWTPFPTVSVPQLPTFDPIPPLTPTATATKQPGDKGRLTTAQVEVARQRFAEKLFPGDTTTNQLVAAKDRVASQVFPVAQPSQPAPAPVSQAKQNVATRVFSSTPVTTVKTATQSAAAKFRANSRNFVR